MKSHGVGTLVIRPILVNESPTVIYDQEGNYTINLEVLNFEGCSDTISKSISVMNSLVLFIPNTFLLMEILKMMYLMYQFSIMKPLS